MRGREKGELSPETANSTHGEPIVKRGQSKERAVGSEGTIRVEMQRGRTAAIEARSKRGIKPNSSTVKRKLRLILHSLLLTAAHLIKVIVGI